VSPSAKIEGRGTRRHRAVARARWFGGRSLGIPALLQRLARSPHRAGLQPLAAVCVCARRPLPPSALLAVALVAALLIAGRGRGPLRLRSFLPSLQGGLMRYGVGGRCGAALPACGGGFFQGSPTHAFALLFFLIAVDRGKAPSEIDASDRNLAAVGRGMDATASAAAP